MEQARDISQRFTWENVGPTVLFGTSCGTAGAVLGSCWALYRPYPKPGLYSFLCFLQYGAYGTVFHGARASYLAYRPLSRPGPAPNQISPPPAKSSFFPHTLTLGTTQPSNPPTRRDYTTYSALAGLTSGALINGIFRGRFILSGGLQFALFGFVGQRAWIWVDERHSRKVARDLEKQRRIEAGEREPTLFERVASLAGMRKMSDEEYIQLLSEKALELEAEIALIDEKIQWMKKEERGVEDGEEG